MSQDLFAGNVGAARAAEVEAEASTSRVMASDVLGEDVVEVCVFV